MRRTKLYSIITAILLVSLFGVQAMAQDTYILPENNGTVTMSDILSRNPSLKGKKIYGDIIRNDNGVPLSPPDYYGGTDISGKLILDNRYGQNNPNIEFKRNDVDGLIFRSKNNQSIEELTLSVAYKKNNDWWKSDNNIIKMYKNPQDAGSELEKEGDSEEAQNQQEESISDQESNPWWVWLLGGFILGVGVSLLLRKIAVSQTKKQPNEEMQGRNVGKQSNSGEKSLTKGEMEEIVNKITEKHSLELFAKLSKLVDEKFVRLESERRAQNNTIPNVTNSTQSVKETRKALRRETEEFCGYAQLPQNGDFALTLTQDPMRTAFVINKRGSDYLVGLIEDEQTLSQLVQPLSDLKANGSNIVDFPEGELQGAQKIVCVDRGIFKEDSIGRIIPIKPIQIKRG